MIQFYFKKADQHECQKAGGEVCVDMSIRPYIDGPGLKEGLGYLEGVSPEQLFLFFFILWIKDNTLTIVLNECISTSVTLEFISSGAVSIGFLFPTKTRKILASTFAAENLIMIIIIDFLSA